MGPATRGAPRRLRAAHATCGDAGFVHPITGARIALATPLPADFAAVVERLRSRLL